MLLFLFRTVWLRGLRWIGIVVQEAATSSLQRGLKLRVTTSDAHLHPRNGPTAQWMKPISIRNS
jgi:hypothetical protein